MLWNPTCDGDAWPSGKMFVRLSEERAQMLACDASHDQGPIHRRKIHLEGAAGG